jgi:transcriptional regulator with XRE-family HTH domain
MPEPTEGPTVLRILLGTQLRRLRESRGITAQEAARAIRGSESKISRIELGRNAIREIDVLDLLTYYGVGAVEREQLLSLAEQANRPGWWHRYNDILPDWFQSYVGMEEAATSIRIYEPQFIPGLLQTHEYAAAVLAVRRNGMSSCARNGSGGSPRAGSSCGPSSRKPRCGGRSGAPRSCAISCGTCSA